MQWFGGLRIWRSGKYTNFFTQCVVSRHELVVWNYHGVKNYIYWLLMTMLLCNIKSGWKSITPLFTNLIGIICIVVWKINNLICINFHSYLTLTTCSRHNFTDRPFKVYFQNFCTFFRLLIFLFVPKVI